MKEITWDEKMQRFPADTLRILEQNLEGLAWIHRNYGQPCKILTLAEAATYKPKPKLQAKL